MSTGCKPSGVLRVWLAGFFLVGLLLSLTGSLSIAWQYHLGTDPRLIGQHFLFLNVGFVISGAITRLAVRRFRQHTVGVAGCILAIVSLALLGFLGPPSDPGWLLGGFFLLGSAAGTLTSTLLHVLREQAKAHPAAVLGRTSFLFGLGCVSSTLTVALTYFAGSVPLELGLLAIVPIVFIWLFASSRYQPALRPFLETREDAEREASLRDLRTVAAGLFGALLFVHFGNEWVVGGWLPILITQRAGLNPAFALIILGVYFLALTLGRYFVPRVVRPGSQRRLLLTALVLSMAGYTTLTFTTDLWGAAAGSILIGVGYAPVYPIVIESLDHRFSFHPGFYQTVLSVAITGAMSVPWLAGFAANTFGVGSILILPTIGTLVVAILTILIRLEARLMRNDPPFPPQAHGDEKVTAANA